MTSEQLKRNELERLIHDAMTSNSDLMVPPGLAEKTIRKLEKKVLFRELILELFIKAGLVLGSLAILAGVFAWMKGIGLLASLYTYFVNNWQIITSLLFLAFITILFDQVGLKFYTTFKKEVV